MGPSPRGPRLLCRLPALLLPTLVLILLVLAVLAVPAEGKPIAMASPDQVKDTERSRPQLWSGPSGTRTSRRSQKVLENMRQIPQWHCLRYRKFDLVTQHKRCRHFRIDRKH